MIMFLCCIDTFAQSQDHEQIRELTKSFLAKTAEEFGDNAQIEVSNIDTRLKLNNCDSAEAFLPPGSKAWGKLTVGVRCNAPKPWQIYISAQVRIKGSYFVAANNLSNAQVMTASDLIKVNGELSNLPGGAITNSQQVIGKTIQGSYTAGTALRADMFRSPQVVQQGQTVKVISNGKGFSVSTEATAMTNANEGQIARVKTNNGQLITGIAKLGGIIEIQN
ncbi:flagellar basal body P-ring formation protein FlgA [Undibacterium sp. LX40W]|uniref:Flagella basal body P-ring formation protein FlgA n=2 Tax=Oxalobacteraceae TaxID=75682 RepID=A0A923HM39_9BURK|nr:flagellar basal body P-ring formation protein FlgA [Undibacterium nitidum]MBC3891116.1 flagellar basal body P-ring formation protein FlgA [Undibacterium sp. LX40W]